MDSVSISGKAIHIAKQAPDIKTKRHNETVQQRHQGSYAVAFPTATAEDGEGQDGALLPAVNREQQRSGLPGWHILVQKTQI